MGCVGAELYRQYLAEKTRGLSIEQILERLDEEERDINILRAAIRREQEEEEHGQTDENDE